ncbi:hypothetical protein [Phyllobacterium sp. UNC302MFCol5.2]|uniref:hypothetical protein n=1 Tax=Phyllobacterium sp. UNC302MFCol5.2 TaxID=1449065 RepID=UPI00047F3EFA|nr:hypothetical protein [Phyllobacterium sp. UNC302MFCol5.2]
MIEFTVQIVQLCSGSEKTNELKIEAGSPALAFQKIRENFDDIVYVNILKQAPISQIKIV